MSVFFFLLILNFNYQIITKDKIAFCFKGEGSPLIFFMTLMFINPFSGKKKKFLRSHVVKNLCSKDSKIFTRRSSQYPRKYLE